MEIILAKKIQELEVGELMQVLMKLQMEDRDAFLKLKELLDDI